MRIMRDQGARMIAIGIEMMIGEIPVGGKRREKIDLLSISQIMIGILGRYLSLKMIHIDLIELIVCITILHRKTI